MDAYAKDPRAVRERPAGFQTGQPILIFMGIRPLKIAPRFSSTSIHENRGTSNPRYAS